MVKTFNSPQDVAIAFADFFHSLYIKKIDEGHDFYVALSGGNSPKIVFDLLAENYKDKIKWEKIHFFWGDERMVPSDTEESNYGVAKRLLFDNIKIPSSNIHFIKGNEEPEKEAARYACDITSYVPTMDGIPKFDLVMLGLGTDGHTLSVFPNQIYIMRASNICEVAIQPQSGQTRITLTGKVANEARNIIFMVTGKNKADIVKTIINRENNYEKYPASLISPETGKLFWYLDVDAAKFL